MNDKKEYKNRETIMQTFFKDVAGKEMVDIGSLTYIMPINYETDKESKIAYRDMLAINLKGKNIDFFKEEITKYIDAYFDSDKYWANPIKHCENNHDKLVHALAILWLNATFDDYEHPVEFIKRYTQFVKDDTFSEFCDGKNLVDISTMRNCGIEIRKEEQEEFQETPDAILLTVYAENKEGKKIEKKLPRVAYGIANNSAYIYGIQGYKGEEDSPEIKKINRTRYQLNDWENIPEDLIAQCKKQEPYAYISLFTFLSMIKEKGIDRVVMPEYLPLRYEGKELGMLKKAREVALKCYGAKGTQKEKKIAMRNIKIDQDKHQKIQYNITNRFLLYMIRMGCDVPGIEIKQTPDENNMGLVVDISKMQPDEDKSPIFYEISQKVHDIMKVQEKEER